MPGFSSGVAITVKIYTHRENSRQAVINRTAVTDCLHVYKCRDFNTTDDIKHCTSLCWRCFHVFCLIVNTISEEYRDM